MKPTPLDLPIIWRGCNWGLVTLKWKNANGDPIPLTGWRARATSLNIDLHATIVLPQTGNNIGVTTLGLTRTETASLKLGVESWDWVWEHLHLGQVDYTFPPFLAGKIQIKDPVTRTGLDLPGIPDIPEIPNGTEPPDFVVEIPPLVLPS
jgi:hypothetical protein